MNRSGPRPSSRLRILHLGCLLGCALTAVATAQPTAHEQRAAHVLRRLTFGPTPALQAQVNASAQALNLYQRSQFSPVPLTETHPSFLALTAAAEPPAGDNSWTIDTLTRWLLARQMYSENQLREVMTAFWEDHFNTSYSSLAGSGGNPGIVELYAGIIVSFFGPCPVGVPCVPPGIDTGDEAATFLEYRENQRFRSLALGNFRELLHASAKSATMMFYLNTVQNLSVAPNENYARELLELHTVGVDEVTGNPNGYTEADIQAVARCFTGWQLYFDPQELMSLLFWAPFHVDSNDIVLSFPTGGGSTTTLDLSAYSGLAEGEAVLNYLVDSQQTKEFICKKLIRHFVSAEIFNGTSTPALDNLLANCVAAWGADGDIAAILNVIFRSAEFNQNHRWDLVRSPEEQVVATVRAFDGQAMTLADMDSLVDALELDLSRRMFRHPSPDGIEKEPSQRISTAQLLQRVNVNQWLYKGVTSDVVASNYSGGFFYDLEAWIGNVGGIASNESDMVRSALDFLYPASYSIEDARAADGFAKTDDFGVLATPFAQLIAQGTPAATLEYRQRLAHTVTLMASLAQSIQK